MFILGLVFGIFVLLFETSTVKREYSTITTYRLILTGWPLALYVMIVAAYYIGTEAVLAATPGKAFLDLRVASLDVRPPSARQAVVRNLLRIVDGLPFLYLVGIITIAASKRDQRIGDMAAQTIVVPARGATSGATDATGAPPTDTDITRF